VTRPLQKQRERFFTEQAIRSLGTDWIVLEECESPDFIIAEGDRRIGLDVSDVFMGPQSGAGSAMKQGESHMHRILNHLRLEYEAPTGIPLHVKFVGRIEPETTAGVVPALIALNLASEPLGYRTVIDTKLGLRVHVTKGNRQEWYSVMDRVGWVDRNPQKIIADAIKSKSKKLPRYQAAVGSDVRLLLVADAIHNSGKMSLQEDYAFDFHGFEAVYLFLYPEAVIVLDKAVQPQ
jgi:hypothetical protein